MNGGGTKAIAQLTIFSSIELKHKGWCAAEPVVIGEAQQTYLCSQVCFCGVECKDAGHIIVFVIFRDIDSAMEVKVTEELGEGCTKITPAIFASVQAGEDSECP